jgi:hypothetical protein
MLRRLGWLTAALTFPAAILTAPAHAGIVTFTRVTTPGTDTTARIQGDTTRIHVAGRASPDLSTVDIVCTSAFSANIEALVASTASPAPDDTVDGIALAVNVPVVDGRFAAEVAIASVEFTCRLRAVPVETNLAGYLGSFTGPLLRTWGLITNRELELPRVAGFSAFSAHGSGDAFLTDASACGAALDTVTLPAPRLGPVNPLCAFALAEPDSDVPAAAHAIDVDGRPGYLAGSANTFLLEHLGLPVTPPALFVSVSHTPDGRVRLVERSVVVRCSIDGTFPPTVDSCPTLVPTGLRYTRTSVLDPAGHRIVLHDSFISTDGKAHVVRLRYSSAVNRPPTGAPGYRVPGRGPAFRPARQGERFGDFGSGAGTTFVRSDRFAAATDDDADTAGYAWSRPPGQLRVVATAFDFADVFQFRYTVHIPARGSGRLQFALTERLRTAAELRLADHVAATLN